LAWKGEGRGDSAALAVDGWVEKLATLSVAFMSFRLLVFLGLWMRLDVLLRMRLRLGVIGRLRGVAGWS